MQLYLLKDWWRRHERFWLTGKGGDVSYLLKKERVYFGFFPEHRNVFNALRNFFLGLRLIKTERPDLLISTGAGIAPPIFLVGKIFGCRLLFLDSYTFSKYPSLSARLVSPLVDKLLVQHKTIQKLLKKAEFRGSIL